MNRQQISFFVLAPSIGKAVEIDLTEIDESTSAGERLTAFLATVAGRGTRRAWSVLSRGSFSSTGRADIIASKIGAGMKNRLLPDPAE